MPRKIHGRWYMRCWAEPTKEKAEEIAKTNLCHGKQVQILKEIYIVPSTGSRTVQWSIYCRPRKFPSVTASKKYAVDCANMGASEMADKRRGYAYTIRA